MSQTGAVKNATSRKVSLQVLHHLQVCRAPYQKRQTSIYPIGGQSSMDEIDPRNQ